MWVFDKNWGVLSLLAIEYVELGRQKLVGNFVAFSSFLSVFLRYVSDRISDVVGSTERHT